MLKEIIYLYNKAGFKIIKIKSNSKLQSHKDTLYKKFGTNLNLANPQEHVPEAEHNNCVIKETVRASFHWLLYNQFTKTMTIMLVMDSAKNSTSLLPKMTYLNNTVHEWFYVKKIKTKNRSVSIHLEHLFKPMTYQILRTIIHVKLWTAFIFRIETVIKEDMNFFIHQQIRLLSEETSLQFP